MSSLIGQLLHYYGMWCGHALKSDKVTVELVKKKVHDKLEGICWLFPLSEGRCMAEDMMGVN